MNILSKNEEKEILIQTVSVTHAKNRLTTYLFLCPYCSYNIIQIQGRVTKIKPGLTPTDDVVTINNCPRCKMKYTFQTTKDRNDETEVILTKFENNQDIWHCYICRTPLLQFNYNDIYLLPWAKKVELPVDVKCSGPNCPAEYYILEVV